MDGRSRSTLLVLSRDGEGKDLTPTAYFGPLNPTIYNRS
jgi:hypothetical protein